MFCDHSWERENTQQIKKLVSASRGKKKKNYPILLQSADEGGGWREELIGCAEISKHVAVHLENTGCLALFGSKTMVQHNVCAVLYCFPLWDGAEGVYSCHRKHTHALDWTSVPSTARVWRSAELTRCPRESRNDHSTEQCILKKERKHNQ